VETLNRGPENGRGGLEENVVGKKENNCRTAKLVGQKKTRTQKTTSKWGGGGLGSRGANDVLGSVKIVNRRRVNWPMWGRVGVTAVKSRGGECFSKKRTIKTGAGTKTNIGGP